MMQMAQKHLSDVETLFVQMNNDQEHRVQPSANQVQWTKHYPPPTTSFYTRFFFPFSSMSHHLQPNQTFTPITCQKCTQFAIPPFIYIAYPIFWNLKYTSAGDSDKTNK